MSVLQVGYTLSHGPVCVHARSETESPSWIIDINLSSPPAYIYRLRSIPAVCGGVHVRVKFPFMSDETDNYYIQNTVTKTALLSQTDLLKHQCSCIQETFAI